MARKTFLTVWLVGACVAAGAGCAPSTSSGESASGPNASGVAPAQAPPAVTAPVETPNVRRITPEEAAAKLAPLQATLDADPTDSAARQALARALYQADREQESLPHFEQVAAELDDRRSLLDLALVQTTLSYMDEARATYTTLLERDPRDHLVLHNMGNIDARRGDYESAVGLYQRSIEAKPDYALAHAHLADCYEKMGQFKEAYLSYSQVMQIEPMTPRDAMLMDDSLYRMASLDIRMGARQRAGQLLVELLNANPEYLQAHYALGGLLMQAGQEELAQQHFDEHTRLLEARNARGAAMGE